MTRPEGKLSSFQLASKSTILIVIFATIGFEKHILFLLASKSITFIVIYVTFYLVR
jgi:hypothetical protein